MLSKGWFVDIHLDFLAFCFDFMGGLFVNVHLVVLE